VKCVVTAAAESQETIRKFLSAGHIHAETAEGEQIRKSLRFDRGFYRDGLCDADTNLYLEKIVKQKDLLRAQLRPDLDEDDDEVGRLIGAICSSDKPTLYNSLLEESRLAKLLAGQVNISLFGSFGGAKHADWRGCFRDEWTNVLVHHEIAVTAAALLRECSEHDASEVVLIDVGGDIICRCCERFCSVTSLGRDELVLYAAAVIAAIRPELTVRVVVYGPGVDAQVEKIDEVVTLIKPSEIEKRLVAAGFTSEDDSVGAALDATIDEYEHLLPSSVLGPTRATAIFRRFRRMGHDAVDEAAALLTARSKAGTCSALTCADIVAAQKVYTLTLDRDSVHKFFGDAEAGEAHLIAAVSKALAAGDSAQLVRSILTSVPNQAEDSQILASASSAQDQLRALVQQGVLPDQGVISKADPTKLQYGDKIPIVQDGRFLHESGWVCQMPRSTPYVEKNLGPNLVFCDLADPADRRINLYHDSMPTTLAMAHEVVARADDKRESRVLMQCLIVMLASNKKSAMEAFIKPGESVYETIADKFDQIFAMLSYDEKLQTLIDLYKYVLKNAMHEVHWVVMSQTWLRHGTCSSAQHSIAAPHFQCVLQLPVDSKFDVHHAWLCQGVLMMHSGMYDGCFIDVRGLLKREKRKSVD
jgi:hypothetical protein